MNTPTERSAANRGEKNAKDANARAETPSSPLKREADEAE